MCTNILKYDPYERNSDTGVYTLLTAIDPYVSTDASGLVINRNSAVAGHIFYIGAEIEAGWIVYQEVELTINENSCTFTPGVTTIDLIYPG